jgi:DNA-directed RNA polymerase sigma subunit (sigma70/sigma32)
LLVPPPLESNIFKKLTESQVSEIRKKYNDSNNKLTHQQLADMYGVTRSAITQIVNYITYKNVV